MAAKPLMRALLRVAREVKSGARMMALRRAVLPLLCMLAWSGSAGAEEVRFGLGAGVGAFPVGTPNLLGDVHLEVELHQTLAPLVAVGATVVLVEGAALTVPTVDLGARWHFSPSLAIGVTATVGAAFATYAGAVGRPVGGATLEAIQWTIAGHHELALRVMLLFPLTTIPDSAAGPFFSVLPLPKLTWTYRF